MSGKMKIRCARCGTSFRSASTKQTLCAKCEARARQERAASSTAAKPAIVPVTRVTPKIFGPGASILVPGAPATASANAAPQPATGVFGSVARTERTADAGRQNAHDAHEGQRARAGADAATPPAKPVAQSSDGKREDRAHAPHGEKAAQERKPRELKPPRQPQPSVELTDELRGRIEARYLELARPVEYDGIRTRIATELSVPKTLVKRAVLEYRQREQMPSWWELQAYTGSAEDLERIRQAYEPHLPVPAVGVHKQIASEVGIEPVIVYQGIKRIRAELRLPQYNPPAAHENATAGATHPLTLVPEAAEVDAAGELTAES
jgi:hypothetical protein